MKVSKFESETKWVSFIRLFANLSVFCGSPFQLPCQYPKLSHRCQGQLLKPWTFITEIRLLIMCAMIFNEFEFTISNKQWKIAPRMDGFWKLLSANMIINNSLCFFRVAISPFAWGVLCITIQSQPWTHKTELRNIQIHNCHFGVSPIT